MQDPTPLSEEFPARMQIISGFHAVFPLLDILFSFIEGADKILDYYRASKGAFLCIQKNKRILHYGYIIKQSL